MPEKLPRLTAAHVIRILEQNGFLLVSQRGSHKKWRNNGSGKQVIVPFHQGKELPIGTLNSILEGSGIPEEDFHR